MTHLHHHTLQRPRQLDLPGQLAAFLDSYRHGLPPFVCSGTPSQRAGLISAGGPAGLRNSAPAIAPNAPTAKLAQPAASRGGNVAPFTAMYCASAINPAISVEMGAAVTFSSANSFDLSSGSGSGSGMATIPLR